MSPHTNIATSIRQRLLNHAREQREDFNFILTRFGIERLLYRIGISDQANRFCLKGAQLFAAWTGELHRPTRDADFLSFGSSRPEDVANQFKQLLSKTEKLARSEDGLIFDLESITAREIRENQEYGGVRVKLLAALADARIPLQVDVGFGDAITPDAQKLQLPTLLDLPAPNLNCFPLPTVIAEKLEALTSLGLANSRMKDFYDLWVIARKFKPDLEETVEAVGNTFNHRKTALQQEPVALTMTFWDDEVILDRWNAFLGKGLRTKESLTATTLLKTLRAFLLPILQFAVSHDRSAHGPMSWNPAKLTWVNEAFSQEDLNDE